MSEIHNTDKYVAPQIYMSLSAIYTHSKTAHPVVATIAKALPILKKSMDLPTDLRIRVAPIKARTTNGRYCNGERLAIIDCRLDWRKALVTLCHEMVHAEQYQTGRLAWNGRNQIWMGQVSYNRGTTYNAYRSQPWEEEAFARQESLARAVLDVLGE